MTDFDIAALNYAFNQQIATLFSVCCTNLVDSALTIDQVKEKLHVGVLTAHTARALLLEQMEKKI